MSSDNVTAILQDSTGAVWIGTDNGLNRFSDGRIHVHLVYTYEDEKFEPKFEEKRQSVYLREKFHGNNPRGYSKWTIAVPDETEIDFKSATGDLFIDGLNVEIEGSTGTGNIEITNAKGEFEISTGTGDVEFKMKAN